MIKFSILTISTRGSRGERKEDLGAQSIREAMTEVESEEIDYKVIPDDKGQIVWQLKRMVEVVKADVVITTGGTGMSPTDVTPEATLEVIQRRLPGFEEAMRMEGFKKTPFAILSRAVVGIRENSIVINLPGSPKGVLDCLSIILPTLPHAVKVARGRNIADEEHTFKV